MVSSMYRVTPLVVVLITGLMGFGWTLQIKIEPQPHDEIKDTWLNITCVVNETSDWDDGRDTLVVTRHNDTQDARTYIATNDEMWHPPYLFEDDFHINVTGSYLKTAIWEPLKEEIGLWMCVMKPKYDYNLPRQKRVSAIVSFKENNIRDEIAYLMTKVRVLDKTDVFWKSKMYALSRPALLSRSIIAEANADIYNSLTMEKACSNKGWTYYKYDETCIQVFAKYNDSSKAVSWYDAQKECRKYGADLVEIHEPQKNMVVNKMLSGSKYEGAWIGHRNRGYRKTTQFHDMNWLDHDGYQPWNRRFTDWFYYQFNISISASDRCVGMMTTRRIINQQWFHATCSGALPYVCSISANGCPDATWVYYKEDRACIRIFSPKTGNSARSWEDAREVCKSYHPAREGDLIRMNAKKSDLIQGLAKDLVRNATIWIGIRNETAYGNNYTQVGGVRLGDYQPWMERLNDPRHRCVAMFRESGKWNNFDCDNSYPFVCSVPRYGTARERIDAI